jgi:predicted lipid-binding transport protein (Tim44 family)
MLRFRLLFALLAITATLTFIAQDADARAGAGSSAGSRGSRTFSAPAPTATMPGAAAPMQRTVTQPSAVGTPAATPAAAQGGLFGRPGGLFGGGMLGGLAAGFLGAGLFGMLFGHGMFGGLGGITSVLGFLLQIGLVVIVARLAWAWWQRRQQQPAFAGPSLRNGPTGGSGLGAGLGSLGGGSPSGAAPASAGGDEVGIKAADFDAFEQLLQEIQTAYGAEDLAALRARVTPEMLSYFAEDLAQNTSRGVVNQLSGVALLQGDLAEAWREGGAGYATVAMRFSLVDRTVERASGRLVDGSDSPMEVTEVWTFRRAPGGSWLLSAIQQG